MEYEEARKIAGEFEIWSKEPNGTKTQVVLYFRLT
jgi:hypothetical protein